MPRRPTLHALVAATCLPWLAAGLASAAGPPSADVVLYVDDDFRGRELAVAGDVRNLSQSGFNDEVSSVLVKRGHWELCEAADYRGRCEVLPPGSHASLRRIDLNDRVSSLRRIAPQAAADSGVADGDVVFYWDAGFAGRSFGVSEDLADFARTGFNDRASSVSVRRGRWEICATANYGGRCEVLEAGDYANLRELQLNDKVSSVRRVLRRGERGR
jgi:hypothetical protein